MKNQETKLQTRVTEPQKVLMEYLDALLSEIDPEVDELVQAPEINALRSAEAKSLAKDEFQILLFEVSGVKFAVPLNKLNGILEWSNDISPMPNRSDWFVGILLERQRQIKIIDTAIVVVPSKFRTQHKPENLKKIILIGDSCWGLACDAVADVVTLRQSDVRWRTNSSKRPWLAGTVIEHMCALLDADEFARMLASDQLKPAA